MPRDIAKKADRYDNFEEEYLTIPEAAAKLNYKVGTMYNKISAGQIPVVKRRGLRTRVPARALAQFMRDNTRVPDPEESRF